MSTIKVAIDGTAEFTFSSTVEVDEAEWNAANEQERYSILEEALRDEPPDIEFSMWDFPDWSVDYYSTDNVDDEEEEGGGDEVED